MKKEKKNIELNLDDDSTHISISPGRKPTDQLSESQVIPKWIQDLKNLSTTDKQSLKEKIKKSYEERL